MLNIEKKVLLLSELLNTIPDEKNVTNKNIFCEKVGLLLI